MKLRSAKQFLKIYLYLMCVGSRKGRKKTGKEEEGRDGKKDGGRKGEVGMCAMTMEVREPFGEVSSLLLFSHGFQALHPGQ